MDNGLNRRSFLNLAVAGGAIASIPWRPGPLAAVEAAQPPGERRPLCALVKRLGIIDELRVDLEDGRARAVTCRAFDRRGGWDVREVTLDCPRALDLECDAPLDILVDERWRAGPGELLVTFPARAVVTADIAPDQSVRLVMLSWRNADPVPWCPDR